MSNNTGGRLKGKARRGSRAPVAAPNQRTAIILSGVPFASPATIPSATTTPSAIMITGPRCSICSKSDNLFRCAVCKVTQYCSKRHQTEDKRDHEPTCKEIRKAQLLCAKEEQKLRNHPGDFFTPPNPFENSVGHFWGLPDTRPYMRHSWCVIEALLKVKTFEAVHTACDNCFNLLRLNRSDNMGIRYRVPSLLIRLGRDQDAYDFLTWWLNIEGGEDWELDDLDLPFLDVVNANMLESVDLVCKRFTALSHQVNMILLKIRLLHELQDLRALNANSIGLMRKFRLPLEVIGRIGDFLPRNRLISGNDAVMKSTDHDLLIKKVEEQIDTLFAAVKESNAHFWPALLKPGNNLAARPMYVSQGSVEEMQVTLLNTFDAWNETPRALGTIRLLTLGMRMGPTGETFISRMPCSWIEEGSELDTVL